jgi:hypothetical protein
VAGLVMAQRQLLAAVGARLPARTVAAAVFASTGLDRLLSGLPATAAAWQAGQYRPASPPSSSSQSAPGAACPVLRAGARGMMPVVQRL